MKDIEKILEVNTVDEKTTFPVHIEMEGDDFKFEFTINMEMAGAIIQYVGAQRDYYAKKYNKII